jgi:hypothetical protein
MFQKHFFVFSYYFSFISLRFLIICLVFVFLRFFTWAVGTHNNLFNRVKCMLECIRITSCTGGLTTMSKLDQLSFMEASTTALLSLISLRYSTANNNASPMMVLPHTHLKSYLSQVSTDGVISMRVGRVDDISLLQTEADKKQSSKFFHQVRRCHRASDPNTILFLKKYVQS